MQFGGDKPIFLQLAEQLEDGILSGAFPEEGQIPSITEYASTYKINPATALKGVNLLVDAGLLYKKRGVGMFVTQGAQEALRQRRSRRSRPGGGGAVPQGGTVRPGGAEGSGGADLPEGAKGG